MKFVYTITMFLVVLWILHHVEGYDVYENKLAETAVSKITKYITTKDSVVKLSLTKGTFTKVPPTFTEHWFRGNSHAVYLKATPKYVLSNNTEVVGPGWIHIKGYGATRIFAENDAKMQARNVLESIAHKLIARGMATTSINVVS